MQAINDSNVTKKRKTSADKPTHVVGYRHEDRKGLIVFVSHCDFSIAGLLQRRLRRQYLHVRSGVFFSDFYAHKIILVLYVLITLHYILI